MALMGLMTIILVTSRISAATEDTSTFTLKNNCPFTIWPAIHADTENISNKDFALEPGGSETVKVYSGDVHYRNVNTWGRTNCTGDSSGHLSCITGDCGSSNPSCDTDYLPNNYVATVAKFSTWVGAVDAFNRYAISLFNGFNLPVSVVPVESGTENARRECAKIGCDMDLNLVCPLGLQKADDQGSTVACRSPCAVVGDPFCPRLSPLPQVFQKACPPAYIYTDDFNGSKDYNCNDADYVIHFCLTNNSAQVHATSLNTMKPLDYLIYPLKLVSRAGSFILGFFTSEYTNFTHLGIWHVDDEQHKLWIANLNSPLTTVFTELQLVMNSSGTLQISNGENDTAAVLDHVRTNNNTVAVLQDSGNFVVMDSGNENQILWQSFDNPSSVLVSGMKLGFNRTTGENYTLTSCLSSYNPASGAFTLSLERIQGSGQLVIRRRGNIYWTSGPWEHQSFRYFPSLNNHSIRFHHKLNFISENDGMYFTFETIGSNSSMLELSPNGEIIVHANGRIPITPYDRNFCYGYERDNGCWAAELPRCRDKENKFEMESGHFVGIFTISEDANSNISLIDCMKKCWDNCSCNAFASFKNDTGCRTWTGNHTFQADVSGKSSRVYVLLTDKSSQGSRKWRWGVGAVSIAVPFLLGYVCYVKIRKHKVKEEKRRLQEQIDELAESDGFDDMVRAGMKMFSISSVMAATNAFLPENKLGEGGFGSVYKGQLVGGREIAVKRLSRTSRQGLREFKSELMLIYKLQHKNLVQLLGCCIHEEERMLIYEYMQNKSLDFFIFDQEKSEELDWKKRVCIIEGVARGLLYLHQYSRVRIIHRDLKASNILLDENMHPKIADFGLARVFKHNEATEAITETVIGTYGYMSPEYVMEGNFSIKSDVFSFGVLVLEIISGRKNSHLFKFDDHLVRLIEYAWELWKAGETVELKDPALGDSFDMNQMLRCIHVSLLCVQKRATNRPTMLQVISMLNNETMNLPVPEQPGFLMGRNDSNPRNGCPISVNGLSFSDLEGR